MRNLLSWLPARKPRKIPGRGLCVEWLEDRLTPAGALGDFVWSDTNANGIQDAGEPGIAGVGVRLVGTNLTTTTDANGNYSFDTTNVPAGGSYWVQLNAIPSGYTLSPLNQGGNDALDNDFYGPGWTDYITISPGITNLNFDCGLVPNSGGSTGLIGDRVWHDNNGNGIQDAGEPGMAGVVVQLRGGPIVLNTTTDANGNFVFNHINPGSSYYLQLASIPTGFTLSPLDAGGNDALDNDFYGPGWTNYITVTAGSVNNNVDAGLAPILPVPSLSISDVTVTEGTGGTTFADFVVTLSEASTSPVTFNFATGGGSATAGTDYQSLSGSLTIPAGETTRVLSVTILGDSVWEVTETYLLSLSSPTNATILDGVGVGMILNDDPEPTVSISDAVLTEGNSGTTNATFTVTMSGPIGQSYQYRVATSNGTALAGADYLAKTVILAFGPGGALSQTVTVSVLGDTFTENTETFTATLTRVQGGPSVADGTGIGTIVDDDPTSGNMSFVTDAWGFAHDQGANGTYETLTTGYGPGAMPVMRFANEYEYRLMFEYDVSRVIEGDVTHVLFTFTTYPGGTNGGTGTGTVNVVGYGGNGSVELADATAAGATLATYAAQPASGTQTIVLDRDAVLALTGGSDWLGLRLQAAVTPTSTLVFGPLNGPSIAPVVTFRTDTAPVPEISINDVTQNEGTILGTLGSTSFNFTLTLSEPTFLPVTLAYATANGTAAGAATLSAGDYVTRGGGLTFQPGQTSMTVNVSVLADGVYEPNETFFLNLGLATNATFLDNQGLATIVNDDAKPTIRVTAATVNEGNSGTTTATFTFTKGGASSLPASVDYSTADDTATARSDYTAASGTVTFAPIEFTKTVTVDVIGDTLFEADERFLINLFNPVEATIVATPVSAFIRNDDAAPVVSVSGGSVAEGDSGTTDITFTVSLSAPSAVAAQVNYATVAGTATAGADFTAGSGTLTFAPGETSKTVVVSVVGEALLEADEQFTFALSSPVNATFGTASATGTIVNDDFAPAAVDDSAATDEGAAVRVAVLANDSDADGDPLTVTAVTSPAHGTAAINAGGTVTYTPAANYNGPDSFTYTISDGQGGTATATVSLTVRPVNDAPLAQNQSRTTAEDTAVSGTVTATDVDGDPLTFVVVAPPTHGSVVLGADGSFTYTPAANYHGPDSFTFKANDGPADSNVATVSITITPVNDPPVAAAGPDQTAAEATTVAFNGAGSFDIDGDPLSYSWTFGDGGTATGPTPTHVFADNGKYTVTLTVSDGNGGVSTDTLLVTVTNAVPTAAAGGASRGVRGQSLGFTFTATDPSPIDMASSFTYSVNWGDGSSGSASGPASGVGLSHTYAAAGTFTVSVTATDKDGGVSATATRTVTVVATEVQGDTLFVGGTNSGERITLRPANTSGAVSVTIAGSTVGTFTPSARIVVYALDGADTVELLTTRIGNTTYSVGQRSVLYGGAGNDTITAAGSKGNNVLLGGTGNDTVTGGKDRDILVGGIGADVLRGGEGDDVLIGSTTDFDDDLAAWSVLVDEWARTDASYGVRLDHLAGTLAGGLNQDKYLNGSTMDADGAVDNLYGDGNNDWFIVWLGDGDKANDRKSGERLTTLP